MCHVYAGYKSGGSILKRRKLQLSEEVRGKNEAEPNPRQHPKHSICDKSSSETSFRQRLLDREPDTFSVIPDSLS